ncbi:GNAT family N-acetyltransferase [Seonamhaeicola sp. MEBiC1930]|uniref:GNAT family N-acetyltransferase n=1 Tax=Seonamhaeicola sp. MEBiC01930 TaxID=2976768 RepID=UPI00324FAB40
MSYPFIDKVLFKNTINELGKEYELKNIKKHDKSINYLSYIPFYLKTINSSSYKTFSFKRFNGFAIKIEKFSSLETFMSEQFGAKSRSKIRSNIKRLETCFDIKYKMYFGSITKQEYDFLFFELKKMIERRFSQRGDEHQAIKDWELYEQSLFSLIRNKKASFFVIYNQETPIDICVNYLYQDIVIDYIRAYDIDYAKFRLGYIDIAKQLEWCFKNNYKIFDLGHGDLRYKRQWCNNIYKCENQITFNNKYFPNIIFGNLIAFMYLIKSNYFNKNDLEIQDTTKRNSVSSKKNIIITNNQKEDVIKDTYKLIKLKNEDYSFLRKIVYDTLYIKKIHLSEINIYEMEKKVTYFLKDKSGITKIHFLK